MRRNVIGAISKKQKRLLASAKPAKLLEPLGLAAGKLHLYLVDAARLDPMWRRIARRAFTLPTVGAVEDRIDDLRGSGPAIVNSAEAPGNIALLRYALIFAGFIQDDAVAEAPAALAIRISRILVARFAGDADIPPIRPKGWGWQQRQQAGKQAAQRP